jgi:hypothetical protein
MIDAVDRRYAHADAHADHWGVRQSFTEYYSSAAASHRVEVVCLDASQIEVDRAFDGETVVSAIRQMVLSVSALLRHGEEMWSTCADWLDNLRGDYCMGITASAAADRMQDFMDDVTDHWFNLVSKGRAECSRMFSAEPAWAALWARVQRARGRIAVQEQAPFRGIGRYAMPRPDRSSFVERQMKNDFQHKPEMPTWASDDVNNLIDLMFESLKPHFDAQGCTEKRTRDKKLFRNCAKIIKRMFYRFSELLWKPELDSVRPEQPWLKPSAVETVVREEMIIMMQPHDGTMDIPQRAQIHNFFVYRWPLWRSL